MPTNTWAIIGMSSAQLREGFPDGANVEATVQVHPRALFMDL